MGHQASPPPSHHRPARLGSVVTASERAIGKGFLARHFAQEQFVTGAAALRMVDHFVMTLPTFAPHMHVGMATVTALFEDARGSFLNRDSLGRDIALKAGDLYCLSAASGAVHEQHPEPGARTHALQVFVDLPRRRCAEPPHALHLRAAEVAVRKGAGYRVRVLMGASGDTLASPCDLHDMTMLDGALAAGGQFLHPLPAQRHAWIYTVAGGVTVRIGDEVRRIEAGQAIAVSTGVAAEIALISEAPAHFVVLATRSLRRPPAGGKV